MHLKSKLLISSFVLGAVLASSSATAKPMKNGKFGVGLQLSSPTAGISVKKEISDVITVQGTLGGGGYYTSAGVRGLYKFQKDQKYDIYGFGGVSYLSYDYGRYYSAYYGDSVTAIGFGGGAGVELDVTKEITVNGELSYTHVNWGAGINGGFGGIGFGVGAHYWF